MAQNLVQAIRRGYEVGRARYGDLGLEVDTYITRVRSIIQKHLGLSPSEDSALLFLESLRHRDLYLATACANESIPFDMCQDRNTSTTYPSAWNTFASAYGAYVKGLAR